MIGDDLWKHPPATCKGYREGLGSLNVMAAILQTTFTQVFFQNEDYDILIQYLLQFVPKCPMDNKAAMVRVMAWYKIGDKSLHKLMANPDS